MKEQRVLLRRERREQRKGEKAREGGGGEGEKRERVKGRLIICQRRRWGEGLRGG